MSKTAEMITPDFGWERATDREIKRIPLEKIHVPAEYERKDSPREDEALTNSIKRSGIEQPVHVIPEAGEFTMVKGTRRLAISYLCRYPTIPAIVEPPAPAGVDPVQYRNRLRFHLSIRQDLTPSQRCEFILQTMRDFGMTQKDVATYLGVDAGSISGWLAIKEYHPSIVQLIDSGEITLFSARSFDGVKTEMQPRIYKALKKEFQTLAGGKLHKLVRDKFSPKRYPEYYVNPERTIEKLQRKKVGRKSRKRPKLTRSEKELLASDLNLKEIELRDLQAEIRELKRINIAAGPVVQAILRNEAIVNLIPKDMLPELHRFSEIY